MPAESSELERPAPQPDEDSQFYWDGLTARRLLVQQCARCRRHRFPPLPACPSCGTPGGTVVELEPRGTVYSWIVVHRAFTPAFGGDVPYVVAVIEVADGCRVAARLAASEPLTAGQAVTGEYVDHGTWTELRFRVTP